MSLAFGITTANTGIFICLSVITMSEWFAITILLVFIWKVCSYRLCKPLANNAPCTCCLLLVLCRLKLYLHSLLLRPLPGVLWCCTEAAMINVSGLHVSPSISNSCWDFSISAPRWNIPCKGLFFHDSASTSLMLSYFYFLSHLLKHSTAFSHLPDALNYLCCFILDGCYETY